MQKRSNHIVNTLQTTTKSIVSQQEIFKEQVPSPCIILISLNPRPTKPFFCNMVYQGA